MSHDIYTAQSNKRWIKLFTREIHLFDWEAGIMAYAENFGGKIEGGFKNQMYLPENGKHGFYYGLKDYQTFQDSLLQKIEKDPYYLEEEAEFCQQSCERMMDAVKNLSFNLKKKSDKELAHLYKVYLERFKPYCFYLEMIPAIENCLEKTLRDLLIKTLRDQSQEKINDYFVIISTKIERVAAEEGEIYRLKLAKALRKGENIDVMIDQYLKDYAWLSFYSLEMEPLKKATVLKEIKEIKNPKEKLTIRLKEIKDKKNRFIELKKEMTVRGAKNLLRWTKILQDYLYLRTYRTEVYRRMLFNLKALADYLVGKTGWRYQDVIHLRPSEVVDYLKNRRLPFYKEIKTRQKHWAIIVKNGKLKFISDKKRIEKIIKKELIKEEGKTEVLKGRVAQRGEKMGVVRIIRTAKDWDRLKKGNILVTHMTTPEMMLVIKRAAAIVTDEGGITCHAAIVAREFGIPCIVGTGNATKILKDGDLVKVDATRGIVEKIKPE